MLKLIRRLQYLFRQRRHEAELAEEIENHRLMEQLRLERGGASADEAAPASRRSLGNTTLAREDARGIWIWPWLESVWQDLKYATRGLWHRPAYTTAAALTLALGIGANAAIFSVIEAVLLRPLPYAEPDRLVRIGQSWNGVDPGAVSPPNFLDFRAASRTFESMSPIIWWTGTLTGGGRPESVAGQQVSAAFFTMLGIQPFLGRAFLPDDDQPGHERVVVLSHELWQRRFGANRRVIGTSMTIDGDPYTIVGVTPAGFGFGSSPTDVWKPGAPPPDMLKPNHRIWEALYVVGRLRPEATLDSARADLVLIAERIRAANPRWFGPNNRWTLVARPLHTDLFGSVRPTLLLLWGAVTVLLSIACANAASLALARATSRQREFAIRIAIGAGRGRLMRLLFIEALLVAGLGAAVGVLLAMWTVPLLGLINPTMALRTVDVDVNRGVLLFVALTSVASGILAGILPAVCASRPGLAWMSPSSAQVREAVSLRSPRGALIVGEVALAVVLLAGAGLVVKSFGRLLAVPPGFDGSSVMLAGLSVPLQKYADDPSRHAFYQATLASLERLAVVQGAAVTTNPPLTGSVARTSFSVVGDAGDVRPSATIAAVSPGFFRTMRIPLLAGRAFTDADAAGAARVIVVDDALARRYFGDVNPIGRQLSFGTSEMRPRPWEIVGVVGHVKHGALDEGAGDPQLYYSIYQGAGESRAALLVRTAVDPLAATRAVEDAIQRVDRDQAIFGTTTMTHALETNQARRKFLAVLVGAFAAMSTALAGLGVFSVIAYSVSRRTQEVGVRVALGARPVDVVLLVVRQGLALVSIGVLVGLLVALVLMRGVAGFLFDVSPTDPGVFAGVAIALVTVSILACVIPARGAAAVDPVSALRV